MTDDSNPYAAPQYDGPLSAATDESEYDVQRVRLAHLSHETSLRSWGGLYVLIGGCGLIGAVMLLLEALDITVRPQGHGGRQMGLLLTLALAVGCASGGTALVYVGRGLWLLRPSIKPAAVTLSVLGLTLFPPGTIMHAHLLCLLLCRKGRMILSPEYAEICRQTPHIRYRAPVWNLVVVGAIVVGLIIFFALLV